MIRKMSLSRIQYSHPILIAIIGGFSVGLTGLPMGWMIGSLFFVAVVHLQKDTGDDSALHPIWKQIAQVILAIQVGKQLDASIISSLTSGWVLILILVLIVVTLLLSIGVGVIFSKMTNTSMMTGILGACPGGVSAVPVLSEQMRANTVVVSTVHVLRVMFVSSTVPILSSLLSSKQAYSLGGPLQLKTEPLHETNLFEACEFLHAQPLLWTLILCTAACLGFSLFHLLKFPSAVLIGSLIGAGTIQYMASSYSGLTLNACVPNWLSFCMQIFIGASLGASFKRSMLNNWKQTLWPACFVNISLMIISIGLAYLSHQFLSVSFDTAILALAPGGLAVMTATAMALKANYSFVIAVQTLRLLFILIMLSLINKWVKHA
jgi:membrane AbrB-like protein